MVRRSVAEWESLATTVSAVEAELKKTLRSHGVGLSDLRALRHLAEAPEGELRMQELAQRLQLDQSSVSRLMVRLESAGLVYRDECPADARGIYAVLKPAGRRALAEALPVYERRLAELLADQDGTSPVSG